MNRIKNLEDLKLKTSEVLLKLVKQKSSIITGADMFDYAVIVKMGKNCKDLAEYEVGDIVLDFKDDKDRDGLSLDPTYEVGDVIITKKNVSSLRIVVGADNFDPNVKEEPQMIIPENKIIKPN